MSERFSHYNDAYDYAVDLARRLNVDVAIRGVREFGRMGYNVSLAHWNDSDYARAEIVTPDIGEDQGGET